MAEQKTRGATTMAACVAMQAVGGGLGWSVLPPLLPTIAGDLGVSHAMGGLVWGAAPLGIAVAAPIGGAAVDRFGPRRVAGLAMIAGALACAARALAVGPWSLAVAMLAFGLHIGFVAPAIPKALAGSIPLAKLGRANGLALLGYTLGTAATVLAARTVLAPLVGGWRPLMVVAGAAMALVAAVWLLAIRDVAVLSRHAGLGEVVTLARDGQMRRLGAVHFLLFGGYLALLGLLPRALTEGGLPPARVGTAVATWLCAAGVANFAGPWLSDRIGLRRPFLLGGALVAGLALLSLSAAPSAAPVAFLVVAAIGGGAFAPLVLALPVEMQGVGPTRVGAALGLLMLIGQAGGFLLSTLTGAAAGSLGFPVALALLGALHLAIVVPALGLRETGRRGAPAKAEGLVGTEGVVA